ncbi:MAG: hypothetical protein AB8B93_11310 [Pseudomonadales bacterium]
MASTKPKSPASARSRLAVHKEPKVVELAKDFGGMKAGQMMYVATPRIVADSLQNIPYGQTLNMQELRASLASANDCDGACPLSTAIFLRVASEAALEDLAEGKSPEQVIPFWRAVEPDSKVASRLDVDAQWIADQRSSEQPAR